MDKLLKLLENMQSLRMDRSLIHGWGLFATRAIPAGEPVIEYTGELIRLPVVDMRQEMYEKQGNHGSYVFRLNDDPMYIDATVLGGPAKFINHSCDPNCTSKNMDFDGETHIVIFSNRDIARGEELSYDYKLDYEDINKRIPCTCGAKNCKRWLNWAEKKPEPDKITITSWCDAYKFLLKLEKDQEEAERKRAEEEQAEKEKNSNESQPDGENGTNDTKDE